MSNLAWATDIHLDFITEKQIIDFGNKIDKSVEGIILSGDISSSKSIVYHLSILEKVVARPIYFVLGNHDYYEGKISDVRATMKELTTCSQYLKYIPTTPYIELSKSTAIVGHDGWYDGLNGNANTSPFTMTDWKFIYEYNSCKNRSQIIEQSKKLSHESVLHIHDSIKLASKYYKNIIIVTHVPPFKESHLYKGVQGDDDSQPWFTSKMLGDMLLDASKTFPNINFTVYCGHTHGRFTGKFANNLIVNVGDAEYHYPEYQQQISFV